MSFTEVFTAENNATKKYDEVIGGGSIFFAYYQDVSNTIEI